MKNEKRRPARFAQITAFALVSLTAAWIFTQYFDKAFPASAIPLEIDKDQAVRKAEMFLETMGYSINDFKVITTFETDEEVDFYLQRKLGIEKLNRLTGDNDICLHYWRMRFCKPFSGEEYTIGIAPNGNFDGFRRKIPENLAGASLDQIDARRIAEKFILDFMALDLSAFGLTSSSSRELDDRTDHSFGWTRSWPELPEAKENILIFIQGNKVGFFEKYISVPEDFSRAYRKERSSAKFLYLIGNILSFAVLICALVLFIFRIIRREKREWKLGCALGLITFTFSLLLVANSFHRRNVAYNTSEGWNVFVWTQILLAFLSALIVGIQIFLYGSVGKSLNRELAGLGGYASAGNIPRAPALKKLLSQCGIAYALTFVLLAYHTVFYLVADDLGAWMPSKPRFSDFLLSHIPMFTILGSGIYAALTEETAYRFFCIPFFKKHLKWTWAAIFIPAVIWGIGHAGHIVYPVYLRIIEVSIIGIIYGVIFIKFGFLPVIISHYLVDAIIGTVITLDSSLVEYKITIMAALLLPIAAIAIYSLFALHYKSNPMQEAERQAYGPK